MIGGARPRLAVRIGRRFGEADQETLRGTVSPPNGYRTNAEGLAGLSDRCKGLRVPRLAPARMADLAAWVEAGPDPDRDGVVRWHRQDLQRRIAEAFGVEVHERRVGKCLAALGLSQTAGRARSTRKPTRMRRRHARYSAPASCGQKGCTGSASNPPRSSSRPIMLGPRPRSPPIARRLAPRHSALRLIQRINRLTLEFRQDHATFLAVALLVSSVHRNILRPTGSGCCT